ncbi:hypothetical protein ZIOFF_026019 [Zingiber officinale]|uniref:Uncharacterized protein n=1 Tax=Zingiber officinale TaxID=94328 RepID=A0A8J5GWS2_ZINOF|nr:hypothetical protein ZIOFF_026019 [Zingiber officinale]
MRIRFPIVIKLGYSQLWGLATFHPLLRGILLQAVLQRLLALETYLPPLRLKGLSLVRCWNHLASWSHSSYASHVYCRHDGEEEEVVEFWGVKDSKPKQSRQRS